MSRRNYLPMAVAGLLALLAAGLVWQGTFAQLAGEEGVSKTPSITDTLGGAERYLTHVSTDKPIYRPGEKMYLRGVMLHHATRRPLPKEMPETALVEITGPKGDVVAGGWVQSEDSVLGFSWEIPQEQAGGQYTIKVSHPNSGYAPGERKFDIRAYRAPRLKSQIKFLRDGYGPGDKVAATLHTERAEGGVPAGAKVTVIARVDGVEAFRGPAEVDAEGNCAARFELPIDIRRGEGTLAMVIEDGGVVETASKTIPILLQTVDLTMYPEGGDLVAGLPSRVYFEAFTPAKKPADLSGVVLDSAGKQVAEFKSEHEGRGRFEITPAKGEKYTLKITQPSGIRTQYPLPDVKESGVVLRSAKDVYPAGAPIVLSVAAAPLDGDLEIAVFQREKRLASAMPIFKRTDGPALAEAVVELPDDASGVLVATALAKDGKPLAERLIYRQPSKSIQVSIKADAEQYTPGGRAKLTVETRDENGDPISAVVGVTVTDDSVLEMIEKREQAPRLPVMVLLEGEVKELADAHVYLDPENEQAPRAVDLLLGTQGWRRFALVDRAKFLKENGDQGRRALALRLATFRDLSSLAESEFAVDEPAIRRLKEQLAPEKPGAAVPGEDGKPDDAPQQGNDQGPPPAKSQPDASQAKNPEPAANQQAARKKGEERPNAPLVPPVLDSAERQDLRKALKAADFEADRARIVGGRLRGPAMRNDFVVVRVYAHEVRTGRQPGERTDFTETLFWHAGLKTDDAGQASFEFGLNDSVTSFRVFADAFASTGSLGSGTLQIDSVEPFYLEPKLPLEVTAGDTIRLPVGVVNATGAPLEAAFGADAHSSLEIHSSLPLFALPAGGRVRQIVDVAVGSHNGSAEFVLTAKADPYADKVTRTLNVVPRGFPIEIGRGGLIGPGDTVTQEVSIPADLVPGSVTARVVVYPTPLASMNEALERLIREPGGCFEQTSSTVYPLVMAQQYFMSHQGVDPRLVERSADILERGYQRLTGFECKTGGYEWFGADPGHDALTAYGLLEFTDMSQVRFVDSAMLERTRTWLLAQRDGKGGFERKTHTYHTWLAEPDLAATYNTWALLTAGVQADLSKEVAFARQTGETSENTYVTALAANVCSLAGDKEGEEHLLDKLAGKQNDDGSLKGAAVSVVGSGGEALAVETTALAVTAWLNNKNYVSQVEKGIKFLAETCKAGRFGSTQSTVLALRAIVAYDASRAKPKAPGSLELLVDGTRIGQPVAFTADTQGTIELPEMPFDLGKLPRITISACGTISSRNWSRPARSPPMRLRDAK